MYVCGLFGKPDYTVVQSMMFCYAREQQQKNVQMREGWRERAR